MFRIVCDPSSGRTELCLTEITRGGSQIFFVCLVSVGSIIFNLWCVCTLRRAGNYQPVVPRTHTAGSKLCCQTLTKPTKNICKPTRVISVKYSSELPDDGSCSDF